MELNKLSDTIFTIDNFWTKQECEDFIAKSELMGYVVATVETEKGHKVVESVRNNARVVYKDFNLANKIWQQLIGFAPKRIGNSFASGLNELFRFYKYDAGQKFKKHRDQSFIRNEEETSYYTFLIYLNDNYEGGETTFNQLSVKPKQGTALLFLHDLEHEGSTVKKGIKYVLRTDIMYRFCEIEGDFKCG